MKKRNFGKVLVTLSLAAVMAFTTIAGYIPVFAQESSTVNGVADFGRGDAEITIVGNQGQSLAGKKFAIYKLFNAENSANLESINYTFNEDYKTALQTIVGKKLNKAASDVTEYAVIDYIQSLNNNQVEGANAQQTEEGRYSDFRYFMEELRDEIVKEGITGDIVNVADSMNENSVLVTGLDYGYYMVDEITNVQDTYSAASLCIVTTANPEASMNIKSDYPSVVKKIKEDDNSISWNDIGDYEIGQTVPFKYESNVPNMNGYDTYYYAWHDKMDEALTFHANSVKVKISNADESAVYTLSKAEYTITENTANGDTFVIEIADLKAIVDREFNQMNSLNENVYGQKVTVTYNATLNDKALKDMGRPGFESDVRLEFSNNPDSDGAMATGFTPWDTVVCFTYQLDVLKVNDEDLELANAKFRLYSDEACEEEVYVKETEDGYVVISRDSVTEGEVPEDAVEMVSDAEGSIIINGLDSQTYYLKETKAPAGYRKLNDAIVLSINPTFTSNRDNYVKGQGETNQTLQDLAATAHVKTFFDGLASENDVDLVTDVDTGTINITVINNVGSKLPITGSSLAILMLGAGTVLVCIYLFTKKKESKDQ